MYMNFSWSCPLVPIQLIKLCFINFLLNSTFRSKEINFDSNTIIRNIVFLINASRQQKHIFGNPLIRNLNLNLIQHIKISNRLPKPNLLPNPNFPFLPILIFLLIKMHKFFPPNFKPTYLICCKYKT